VSLHRSNAVCCFTRAHCKMTVDRGLAITVHAALHADFRKP